MKEIEFCQRALNWVIAIPVFFHAFHICGQVNVYEITEEIYFLDSIDVR